MRVLVLSGGGAKGAYQVGALKYILNDLKISYDAFCGVSVGALNGAFLSMFPTGAELEMYAALESLWHRIDNLSIFKRWFPFGRLHGLWKSSLYDSSPLIKWIESEINVHKIKESGKICSVGAVSLTSGKYMIFDQNYQDFLKAVTASSSYPGIMTPIKMENQYWSDGGIREITPIRSAIDLGATQIDIIMTSPSTEIKQFPKNPNAINVLTRTLDLISDEIITKDMEKLLFLNELIRQGIYLDKKFIKINVIRPDNTLTNDSLDFNQHKIKEMMNKGYLDAKSKYIL